MSERVKLPPEAKETEKFIKSLKKMKTDEQKTLLAVMAGMRLQENINSHLIDSGGVANGEPCLFKK